MGIPFSNTYSNLPERFFARQPPLGAPKPKLLKVNGALAKQLGIDPDWLETEAGLEVLSGNGLAEGSEPIAQAYAGHQFGHFSPQLGDGRAVLLGEVLDEAGKRFDIQLKGSGRTPFSRNGDGKSALGPVVREYLMSEAMAALGVPTTRALAAVATGETVFRQEGDVEGGVFTRVASSHIRVGTFEYFARAGDIDGVRELADYAIERHYPEALDSENRYLEFLRRVIERQAELIAQWMSLGFIHGVMNTDNMTVSGETIDYGPCAFMEAFHPRCVFSSIDSRGRYAWGNQGNIGLWNLSRLAECLLPLIDESDERSVELAKTALEGYEQRFGSAYVTRFQSKLGGESVSKELIQETLRLLEEEEVDFTLFFGRLTSFVSGGVRGPLEGLFASGDRFDAWFENWAKTVSGEEGIESMRGANPVRIPRNHRVEQAIQAAYRGDLSVFNGCLEAWENPFVEDEALSDYEELPKVHEVVHHTFCGT